ncbi:MAG TPA: ABC transporter permease [Verrucomicrobiae bacterium]|nr:ABC transporter permease [Verrucomicrobiae bacterium]
MKIKCAFLLAELRESFFMAMSAVRAHKLRSALTLLGVLIGVFSIIVVMTAMRVLQNNIEREIGRLGSQTFMIRRSPGVVYNQPKGTAKIARRKNITLQQGLEFQERATFARNVGLQTELWAGEIDTMHEKTAPDVQMLGETPGSFPARNWNVAEGRALLDFDVDNARDICVLGGGLAKKLFPSSSPVGERLKIDGINYLVVGVLETNGASLGGDQDNFAVIPVTTGLNRYGSTWRSLDILVQAPDQDSYDDCVEQAEGLLRVLRKVPPGEKNDFEISSNDSMIAQFKSFTFAVRFGVMLVSSIALLAAGVGIMNIMLVSVTERTREIGIRRAIGAKKRNIMLQFIMEAVALCELGGIIGVIFGIIGGNATAWLLKMPAAVPVDWVIIGLLICSAVGIIFGTYPAWKAANLDPIESLRYE